MANNIRLKGDFNAPVRIDAPLSVTGRTDFASKNVYIGNIPLESVLGGSNVTSWEVTTDTEHRYTAFYVRTYVKNQSLNDVTVEWGDGEATILRELPHSDYFESPEDVAKPQNHEQGEYNVWLRHTYPETGRTDKYDIRVMGTTYWGLGSAHYDDEVCLVSKCLDEDHPLFSGVCNLANFAAKSPYITEIHIPNYYDTSNVINWSGAFQECSNLETVKAHKSKMFIKRIYAAERLFNSCVNLRTSDWNLPAGSCKYTAMAYAFYRGCVNLESDINDLLPASGFHDRRVDLRQSFLNCTSMTGTAPADILWDDTTKVWTSTQCFENCISLLNWDGVPSGWR